VVLAQLVQGRSVISAQLVQGGGLF